MKKVWAAWQNGEVEELKVWKHKDEGNCYYYRDENGSECYLLTDDDNIFSSEAKALQYAIAHWEKDFIYHRKEIQELMRELEENTKKATKLRKRLKALQSKGK